MTRENVGHVSIVVAGERLLLTIGEIRQLIGTDIQSANRAVAAAQFEADEYNNAIAGTPYPRFSFPGLLSGAVGDDRALAAARVQVTTAVDAEQLTITTNQATIGSQRVIVTARQELIDRYRSDPTP